MHERPVRHKRNTAIHPGQGRHDDRNLGAGQGFKLTFALLQSRACRMVRSSSSLRTFSASLFKFDRVLTILSTLSCCTCIRKLRFSLSLVFNQLRVSKRLVSPFRANVPNSSLILTRAKLFNHLNILLRSGTWQFVALRAVVTHYFLRRLCLSIG